MTDDESALNARLDALERMLDEREERTKERFVAMDRAVSSALMAADKAVSKAESATEKRFEGVNEFRETLRDQAATLMPRIEYEVNHKSLITAVTNVTERVNRMENTQFGKKEGLGLVGQIGLGIMAIISAAAAIASALLHR